MTLYIVVFIVYFLFIVVTSLQSTKTVETMTDFTTGGSSMGLVLGVGTSIATWLSVASVMGVPGNLYSRGLAAIIGWIAGWFMATALMPLFAYKIRMPERPSRTFPEFIRQRYDTFSEKSWLQVIVALIEFVGYFAFSYIQIQGFGIVVETVTGLPYNIAVFLFLAVLLFTCLGGFKSVAATDTFNAVLIFVGVIAGAIASLNLTGGFGNIMSNLATTTAPTIEGGPPLTAGLLATPLGTFSVSALASIFLSNSLGASVAPHWVARFMAPKNAKTAALQMFVVLVLLVFVFVPLIIIGLGAKLVMPSLPAGVTSDYMFPTFIVKHLSPIIGALSLTAICAAAVSTANSMLLHCATSLVYDIKRALSNEAPSEESDNRTKNILRYTILGLGVLACFGAILRLSLLADGFTYVYGAFGATFFVVVAGGLYWKRFNKVGAHFSMLSGMVAYIYCMVAGTPFGLPAFLFSVGVSLIFGLIGTFATKAPPLEAYEAYFTPHISPSTMEAIKRIRKDTD